MTNVRHTCLKQHYSNGLNYCLLFYSRMKHWCQHEFLIGGETRSPKSDGHWIVGRIFQIFLDLLPFSRVFTIHIHPVNGQSRVTHCTRETHNVTEHMLNCSNGPVTVCECEYTHTPLIPSRCPNDTITFSSWIFKTKSSGKLNVFSTSARGT